MAEHDSVTPRLNHKTQHNYLFNVELEIKLFNFYEKQNPITNTLTCCFPYMWWSLIQKKMYHELLGIESSNIYLAGYGDIVVSVYMKSILRLQVIIPASSLLEYFNIYISYLIFYY